LSIRSNLSALALLATLPLASCAAPLDPDVSSPISPPRIGAEMVQAADGAVLPMRSWLPGGPPRAVIVALHGFADYSKSFDRPAKLWASVGIATFAYDQRGFGGAPHMLHWAGAETMAGDARDVVALMHRRYPGTPVYLLGESMGGAVALLASTGNGAATVDGVILVSPAVWEHDFMGAVERSLLTLATLTVPGLWLEAPRGLGIHPSNNIPMLRAMARDSLVQTGARADTTAGLMDLMDAALPRVDLIRQPTLVLFGAHEEILPKDAVRDFLNRLPARDVTVALYPSGYHMLLRDLDGGVVADDVRSWIFDHRAALPSGDACAGITASSAPCRHGA
jgi:alpha-beta hydrolase superfamily lysophospholipase